MLAVGPNTRHPAVPPQGPGCDLLAVLVNRARELAGELRSDSVDPLVQAGAEVLEAADSLFRLSSADELTRRVDLMDALHVALDCLRAATIAVRFAVVEEGDRERQAHKIVTQRASTAL